MPLVPNQSFVAADKALFARSSGGGGSVGGNPYFSSISTGAVLLENINSAGQFPYRLRANSGSAFFENMATGGLGDLSLSTLTVSSITTPALQSDNVLFQAVSGSNTILIDPAGTGAGGLYPSGDATILFPNSSYISEDGGGNLSINPGIAAGAYISIDTCIPDCYRVQLEDNTQAPGVGQIVAQIYASPTSVFIGDANQSSFALSVSSISVSTINGTAPALTSGSLADVAGLFSSLFAANPALSTITY